MIKSSHVQLEKFQVYSTPCGTIKTSAPENIMSSNLLSNVCSRKFFLWDFNDWIHPFNWQFDLCLFDLAGFEGNVTMRDAGCGMRDAGY